ncbi:MAG: hypothetical protein CVV23_12060 [Ignavibacteriae bacterium HGW-Ignavibacteriae-2]|jgi:uncharacterized membrane protein YhiD involved in acid resistance|nr:DUF4956 domain-containing protein [Bacteroidota bacterium]PKL88074.1 MAG: hypothetical protein CVV23_12060 [Ignavibacteriae bacterium HGW-Ignavibacteriae-2]
MLQELTNIFEISLSFSEIAQNLFVALICGLIITFFYRKTYQGPGYLNSFVNSLVILSLITAIVIMIIGNNLARAFGLVGAMSIIRFRTAVKETQDIIYIFFSLSIGMAAGVGLHLLALSGSIIVGLISFVLTKSSLITPSQKDFLFQFTFNGNGSYDEKSFINVLDKFCKSAKLINVKSVGDGSSMEYSYYIAFRSKMSSSDFISEFRTIKGIKQINLFFDEEYF